MQLYKLADGYTEAAKAISAMVEAGELDAVSAADTLEGLGGDLQDKAINTALHIKNLRSDIEQLESAKKAFDARIKAAQSELDFFESYLDANLRKAGINEIKSAMAVIKYKKLPAIVEVTGDVPDQYQRVIPEKREPDKRAIAEALKQGLEVSGAQLIDGRTKLEIK